MALKRPLICDEGTLALPCCSRPPKVARSSSLDDFLASISNPGSSKFTTSPSLPLNDSASGSSSSSIAQAGIAYTSSSPGSSITSAEHVTAFPTLSVLDSSCKGRWTASIDCVAAFQTAIEQQLRPVSKVQLVYCNLAVRALLETTSARNLAELFATIFTPAAQEIIATMAKGRLPSAEDLGKLQKVHDLKDKKTKGLYGAFHTASQQDGGNPNAKSEQTLVYFGKATSSKKKGSTGGIMARVQQHESAEYRAKNVCPHYWEVYGNPKVARIANSPLPLRSPGNYYVFATFSSTFLPEGEFIAETLLILTTHACFKGTVIEAMFAKPPPNLAFKGTNSFCGLEDHWSHGKAWGDSDLQAERARLGRAKLEEQKVLEPVAYKADRVKGGIQAASSGYLEGALLLQGETSWSINLVMDRSFGFGLPALSKGKRPRILLKRKPLEAALGCQLGNEKTIEGSLTFTSKTVIAIVINYQGVQRTFNLNTEELVLWNEKNANDVKSWVATAEAMI